MAWAGSHRPGCSSAKAARVRPDDGEAAALSAAGAERDLAVHARRPEPPRDVRPQAGASAPRRPAAYPRASASSRRVAPSPAIRCSPRQRTFRPCGQSGLEISDFLPHLARHADDLAVIRSCWADSVNHPQAVYQMNTGSILMGRPSLGSWVAYGLGTEDRGPARLRRPARPGRRHQGRPARLWRGLSAGHFPGDRDARRRQPDPRSAAARAA